MFSNHLTLDSHRPLAPLRVSPLCPPSLFAASSHAPFSSLFASVDSNPTIQLFRGWWGFTASFQRFLNLLVAFPLCPCLSSTCRRGRRNHLRPRGAPGGLTFLNPCVCLPFLFFAGERACELGKNSRSISRTRRPEGGVNSLPYDFPPSIRHGRAGSNGRGQRGSGSRDVVLEGVLHW